MLSSRAWLAVLLAAIAYVAWIDAIRIRRIAYVSGIGESVPAGRPDGNDRSPAPTGWQPRLIVPAHDNASYEWLGETRQMIERHEVRVRRLDYENAPFGREVYATSPYRLWLGAIAWFDHAASAHPVGQSLERAALVADPLLLVALMVGAVFFVLRQFGGFSAAILGAGLAAAFPFSAEFLPGMPDDRGLARAIALWSGLLLLAGLRAGHSALSGAGQGLRRWFLAGGIAGGLGLWLNVSGEAPILIGIMLGGMIAAAIARAQGKDKSPPLPWRAWTFGGAVTTLAACLVEYFPSHLGNWQLRTIHPLYGLAWLGAGEILARLSDWIRGEKMARGLRDIVMWIFALAALAALPVAMRLNHNFGFFEADLSDMGLTRLPDGPAAPGFVKWIYRDGLTPAVWAAVLPFFCVGPAAWLMLRRDTGPAGRTAIALALGPVLVALGFALRHLSWWSGLDAMVLVLLVAVTAATEGSISARTLRWIWTGLAAAVFLPGMVLFFPKAEAGGRDALNEADVYGLIERDLARWLTVHSGRNGAVVLAPHNETFTLYYYGGLKGLATLGWENLDGLEGAMRIVSASTPEEARELIERRGISHLVIPSWDSYLDVYARMGMGKLEGTFLDRLHHWRLPPWLRPVSYRIPTIAGFEGQSVIILEMVDDQDDAVAMSRMTEYFVEMGQLDVAANSATQLRRYPADLGALVARAQVEMAREDSAESARLVDQLRARLAAGADRAMAWDRRVSLAVVLARAKQTDLAREQVRRCVAEVDEADLRLLSTGALYRLGVLEKAFGLELGDPHLRQLALDLLPDDLRARLKP